MAAESTIERPVSISSPHLLNYSLGSPIDPVHAYLFREPDVRLDRAHLGAVAQQTPDPAGRPLHGSAGSAGLGGRGKPFADLRLCEDKEEQHRKDRADETKMPTNSVAEMPIRTRRDCVAEGNGSAESLTGPDPALLIGCRRDADCTWARMNTLEKDFESARVSATLCLKQTVHRRFSVARPTGKNRAIGTRFSPSGGAQPSRSAREACSRSSGVSPPRRGGRRVSPRRIQGKAKRAESRWLKRPVR